MSAGKSGNTFFSNLRGLDLPGAEDAADKLERLCTRLRHAGADGAADRFEAIDIEIADGNRSFDDLERRIEPDRAVDELNSARGRVRWRKLIHGKLGSGLRPLLGFPKSVRYSHLLRNVFALAPLIFTWIMLGLAAKHYDSYLAKNPKAANEPFLLLWQQGFGSRHFLTFQQVTLIDFGLLACVVLLTFWVHWAEGQADRSAYSVYEAVYSLKAVLAHSSSIPTSLTPENYAVHMNETLAQTIQQTQELNKLSERAIKEASDQLKSIQDTGKEFIEEFKKAVLETLTSVTQQNEHFISTTRETNQQVLQALVEQQMRPLLNQVEGMLEQFKTQQATYTAAVTNLTGAVGAIQESAGGLATSAQALKGSTQSVATSLAAMASSQDRFASKVEDSAQSMTTAAAAMTEVKDTLRVDLHQRLQEMTGNLVNASTALSTTQGELASTTAVMKTAALALAETTDGLSEALSKTADNWATTLSEPMELLREALSRGGFVKRRRRRFLIFGRRS
jgi:hypothetical protein